MPAKMNSKPLFHLMLASRLEARFAWLKLLLKTMDLIVIQPRSERVLTQEVSGRPIENA